MLNPQVETYLEKSSLIRKMFTEGARLKKEYGKENVYDFSLGNPDIPAPEEVHKALHNLTAESPLSYEHGYCPNAGLPELQEKLAKKLSDIHQVKVPAQHVTVTSGAAGAVNAFFRAVLCPGDEVITFSPYFVEYGFYAENYGARLKTVPTDDDFLPDIDALEKTITERTRVCLINSPHNPTGVVYSEEVLRRIVAVIESKNSQLDKPIFLLSDEPYRFLAYDGKKVPPVLNQYPYSVVASSFSKDLSLAGERIGYLAISPYLPDAEKLAGAVSITNRILGFVNAPLLMQRMLLKTLNSQVDISLYKKRRDALAEVLCQAGIEFTMPHGAFYFFPKNPLNDDSEWIEVLKRERILAVPGFAFGTPGYFRLSFCVSEETIHNSREAFQRAMKRISN